MLTSNFMAKQDDYSLGRMNNFFSDSDQYVYFIEDQDTQKWITKEKVFTNNPLEALSFPSRAKACTYAIENDLANKLDFYWVITEHEFVKQNEA